jgi:hypothetical protein
MDQETFNLSIRKFLKMVGISSQREIEQAVASGWPRHDQGQRDVSGQSHAGRRGPRINVSFEGEIRLQ